jgi:hypothetical protein
VLFLKVCSRIQVKSLRKDRRLYSISRLASASLIAISC